MALIKTSLSSSLRAGQRQGGVRDGSVSETALCQRLLCAVLLPLHPCAAWALPAGRRGSCHDLCLSPSQQGLVCQRAPALTIFPLAAGAVQGVFSSHCHLFRVIKVFRWLLTLLLHSLYIKGECRKLCLKLGMVGVSNSGETST